MCGPQELETAIGRFTEDGRRDPKDKTLTNLTYEDVYWASKIANPLVYTIRLCAYIYQTRCTYITKVHYEGEIMSLHYRISYLLYVAWADQRHRQCCIRHTEQFLNGTVLYDGRQGEGGRTFAFPRFGELTSA